jgi:hypothetical protein
MVNCHDCGGVVVAQEVPGDEFICLILSCSDCEKIINKEWRRKI